MAVILDDPTSKQLVVTIRCADGVSRGHIQSEIDGKYYPVEDSDYTVHISWSRKLLMWARRRGDRNNKRHCFFAVGLRADESLGILEPAVGPNFTYLRLVQDPKRWIKFTNTEKMKTFIAGYDVDSPAVVGDIFTFELLPVSYSNTKGYRKGKSGTRSKRKPPSFYERNPLR